MSKKFVKALLFLSVFSLLALSLAGCGGKEQPASSTSGDSQAADTTAIEYPTREIEFIVPWAPGGGSDIEGRLVAEYVKKNLNDTDVIVINLPGVGGTVGLEELSEKPADGYNIGQVHEGLLVAHHSDITPINYDDFVPIATMSRSNQYLAVANHLNVDTLEEFVEYGQKETVRFGGTVAGIPRVWLEQIGRSLEINYNLVGYEGLAEAIQALAGGHIDAAIVDYSSASDFVEAGHMKFIAIGTENRVDAAPDVPTFKENGYDISLSINRGLVAPKGTPQEIIDILGEALEKTANDPAYIEAVKNVGADVNFMGPAEYKAYLDSQNAIIKEIIEDISK